MFWVQVFMQVEFWNETLFLRKKPKYTYIHVLYLYYIYIILYIYSAHAQLSIPLHSKGAVFLGIKAAIMRNGFGSWKLTQCRQSRISPLMFYHDLRLVLKYALRTHFFVQWIVVKMYDDPSAWWFSMIMIFCTLFFLAFFQYRSPCCIEQHHLVALKIPVFKRSERRVSRRDLSLYFVHWLTVRKPKAVNPTNCWSVSKGNDATQTTAFNSSFSMRVCAIAFWIQFFIFK